MRGATIKTTLLPVFLVCYSILAGCSNADSPASDDSTDGSASDRPVIALIMKSLANEFFVTMADGARDHQAANSDRYQLIVNGIKNEIDLAQQVALIDQMIAYSGRTTADSAIASRQSLMQWAWGQDGFLYPPDFRTLLDSIVDGTFQPGGAP